MPRGVENADHLEPQPGCWDVMVAYLKACGLLCYIACPPVPSYITRKLAFHPPEKGVTYRLEKKSAPGVSVRSAADLHGDHDDINLILRNVSNGMDCELPADTTEVFTVKTSNKNTLVGVRCMPFEPSSNAILEKQVILFCQPNSSDLGGFLQPQIMNLHHYADIFCVDVYAFDYSGYGYSSGTQGEKNVYADVRAVYQHIRDTRPDKYIVLMGYSIGTTAVIDLASTNPPNLSGVVLIAPFTSSLRLVSQTPNKPNTCWADSFKSYDKVEHINTKVLVCHGDVDEVIPLSHGLALYEKLKNPAPPAIVHGANHLTILSGRHSNVFGRIHRFLKQETVMNRTSDIEEGMD